MGGTVIHCDTEAGRGQIGLLTPAKVCGAIAPVLADMASDLIQVATFLKRNSYFQAFLLLAMAFKSAFSEGRTLLNLRAELRDSSNLGYYTNSMMELLAIEQGAEAALSLVLVLYSFHTPSLVRCRWPTLLCPWRCPCMGWRSFG